MENVGSGKKIIVYFCTVPPDSLLRANKARILPQVKSQRLRTPPAPGKCPLLKGGAPSMFTPPSAGVEGGSHPVNGRYKGPLLPFRTVLPGHPSSQVLPMNQLQPFWKPHPSWTLSPALFPSLLRGSGEHGHFLVTMGQAYLYLCVFFRQLEGGAWRGGGRKRFQCNTYFYSVCVLFNEYALYVLIYNRLM